MPRLSLVQPTAIIMLLALAACGGGDGKAADTSALAGGASATTTAAAGGELLYQQRCLSCHQANGEGLPGTYPALAGSEYATAADAGVPIRIVMHGIAGPITVKGTEYNSLMPPYGVGVVMTDDEIASLLTYIRSSWGNAASAVTEDDVEEVREATASHSGSMTAELLKPMMAKK